MIWLVPKNLRKYHAPSKNEYDRVPPKCDKWPQNLVEHGHISNFGGTLFETHLSAIKSFLKNYPCSTKIWKMTVFHQNLRSDHAPSKNKNDRAPPKCDKWPQILVEHLIFGPACLQLRVFSKNDRVPPKFEKRPCSTKKNRNDEKWPSPTKNWEVTMLHRKI